MHILSTNIAQPTTIEWRGQAIQTGIYKHEVDTPLYLGTEDVVNDHVIDRRYHGGTEKACYLYSADHYPFWKQKYPQLTWEWGMFGENLTVTGLHESQIRIGDRFQIGETIIQVTQPRQPCFKLGLRFGSQKVVNEFWDSSFPGVYVRILQPGHVAKGDKFTLLERNPDSLSVEQVFSLFGKNNQNIDMLKKAIAEPFMAQSCRKDLQKILDNIK
ncbi:MAG TPA: MOSC domain-containing protein [Prolixibacteraceae bacterium]|jgi:MOSC domain-containing protein YiiM|nr:MOSC domain-containing protein [Prolixibacteraceae bacterium]